MCRARGVRPRGSGYGPSGQQPVSRDRASEMPRWSFGNPAPARFARWPEISRESMDPRGGAMTLGENFFSWED